MKFKKLFCAVALTFSMAAAVISAPIASAEHVIADAAEETCIKNAYDFTVDTFIEKFKELDSLTGLDLTFGTEGSENGLSVIEVTAGNSWTGTGTPASTDATPRVIILFDENRMFHGVAMGVEADGGYNGGFAAGQELGGCLGFSYMAVAYAQENNIEAIEDWVTSATKLTDLLTFDANGESEISLTYANVVGVGEEQGDSAKIAFLLYKK